MTLKTSPSRYQNVQVHILGCGSAYGVPVWTGEKDSQIVSLQEKDRRLRPSVWLTYGDQSILIDASPDLRYQALRAGITHLDAVLITHRHADHTAGLNELNILSKVAQKPIPLYADRGTLEDLQRRFKYAFKAEELSALHHPVFLEPREIKSSFTIGRLSIHPIEQDHGFMNSLGFRIGKFAYSTDVVRLSDQAFEELKGVEVWVVDCLKYDPSLTHSHLAQTLEWIERLGPKRAILTHLGPDFRYETLMKELPQGVEVAYDGMLINVPV